MAFSIQPVQNRKDLRAFIRLPYKLYRDDSIWVPPLLLEEKKKYSEKTNPMLSHCDVRLFLLLQNGKAVGRISAFIDRLAVEHWRENVGLFGSFECIDDVDASQLLLDAARSWLRERGMAKMRGSWSFASQEWGILVKGFDSPPMIMAPYNPPFYNVQMESFGLNKVKDLMVYELDMKDGYELPERFLRMTDRIAEKYGVTVRSVNMKRLEEDVKTIVDVANASTKDNWGFIPVTDEEAHDMAKSLKPVVDPDAVMIAEIDGKPIGYLIGLPDINIILRGLNGRLFPFGFLKLLFGLKKIRQYRIWALGVIPEYQRKAIDTLFYRRLYDVLSPKRPDRIEANYVLEDNMVMNNPILKMGFNEVKKYRVYEMDL
ncbi:MAG: N-acetyltransferase [bacterium]